MLKKIKRNKLDYHLADLYLDLKNHKIYIKWKNKRDIKIRKGR